jgi:hypothetical protein
MQRSTGTDDGLCRTSASNERRERFADASPRARLMGTNARHSLSLVVTRCATIGTNQRKPGGVVQSCKPHAAAIDSYEHVRVGGTQEVTHNPKVVGSNPAPRPRAYTAVPDGAAVFVRGIASYLPSPVVRSNQVCDEHHVRWSEQVVAEFILGDPCNRIVDARRVVTEPCRREREHLE